MVKVDDNTGTLSSIAPGKATITVSAIYFDYESDAEYEYKTTCEVIVNEPKPEPGVVVTYRPTEGTGQTWQRGSKDSVVFIYKRSVDDEETINHLKGLKVDGEEISETVYTKEAGSAIITIKPEYLETLTLGKHSVEPVFDDGEVVSTYFAVVRKQEDDKEEEDTEEETSEEASSEENITEEITTENKTSEELTTEGKSESENEDTSEGKNKKSETTTQDKKSNAKTGDENAVLIAFILGLLGLTGIVYIVRRKIGK